MTNVVAPVNYSVHGDSRSALLNRIVQVDRVSSSLHLVSDCTRRWYDYCQTSSVREYYTKGSKCQKMTQSLEEYNVDSTS
jgi:tRNA U38,U39,U40 pseudouridine synthase TruA